MAHEPVPPSAERGQSSRIRAPGDLLAGGCLVALAGFVLWSTRHLDAGTMRTMGPGMFPHAVAGLILVVGVALMVFSTLRYGRVLGRWTLRGPIAITLAIVAFALTIRTVGLAVAGPLVMIVGGAASPDTRPRELVIYAIVMTALCVGLFRFVLSLPIPVLIIPGIVTI